MVCVSSQFHAQWRHAGNLKIGHGRGIYIPESSKPYGWGLFSSHRGGFKALPPAIAPEWGQHAGPTSVFHRVWRGMAVAQGTAD